MEAGVGPKLFGTRRSTLLVRARRPGGLTSACVTSCYFRSSTLLICSKLMEVDRRSPQEESSLPGTSKGSHLFENLSAFVMAERLLFETQHMNVA